MTHTPTGRRLELPSSSLHRSGIDSSFSYKIRPSIACRNQHGPTLPGQNRRDGQISDSLLIARERPSRRRKPGAGTRRQYLTLNSADAFPSAGNVVAADLALNAG